MHIDALRDNWDAFGTIDPLWAILTDPAKKGGKWDLDEFFQSGEERIGKVMRPLDTHGIPRQQARALDFGCGVGRFTRALAKRFERVDGVDIAASMIEQADRLNEDGDRVRYHLNERPDLSLFDDDSFDLVLTELVLQHMHPRYAMRYLLEFVRVVRPGGAVYFQLPGELQPLAAMPDEAYRAHIEILSVSPEPAIACESLAVSALVRNDSGVDWPATADIKLGNHWKTDGETVVLDDGRTWLAGGLASGDSMNVTLQCTVPDAAGVMVLELDLVQEHVAWFEDKTGEVVRRTIEVAPAVITRSPTDALDDPIADESAPRMEIYGTPAPFVRTLLELAGARVLDVLPDNSVGGRWESFAYIATKQ